MIKSGQAVFFGCDVGKFSDSPRGIMDTALYEYEVRNSMPTMLSPILIPVQSAFSITLDLTKADRLRVNESSMTHAMVISGVHLDKNGKPVRYKVENSWGESPGDKGYFVMSDKWFEE